MAIATRELELILIAKDRTASVMARVGGAIAIIGAAMVRLGQQGAAALKKMGIEAFEFQQDIALAFTQAENVAGASLESIKQTAKDVASSIPAPFEEMTGTLFDIFSTLDVTSMDQVQMILEQIAESAVAGQAPMEDIGRSVISWLNALDQEPTLENINRILGVQFELVRKGAGTYTEFAGEIGKTIPAFVSASQSVETFGGILAFLTRNGLDAAMASTSAARAVELMFTPKAIKNMTEMGIAVVDNEGNFRQMNDVIRDLLPHFANLDDAQKKIKFKEIFGTGRIQARRFFDLALENFAEMDGLIKSMSGGASGLEEAYKIMFEQPLSKMQLLENQWAILRTEIGDRLLPIFEERLIPAMEALFDWWDKLDDIQQDQIVTWAAYSTVILAVAGALGVVLGTLVLLVAIFKAMGAVQLVLMIAKFNIWLTVIAAIALGLWWVWNNTEILKDAWEDLQALAKQVWEGILGVVLPIIDFIATKFMEFIRANTEFWELMWQRLGEIAEAAVKAFQALVDLIITIWNAIFPVLEHAWDIIAETWDLVFGLLSDIVVSMWNNIKEAFDAGLSLIRDIFDFFAALFSGDWSALWDSILFIFADLWDLMIAQFEIIWDLLRINAIAAFAAIFASIRFVIDGAIIFIKAIWDGVLGIWQGIWDGIKAGAITAWEAFKTAIMVPVDAAVQAVKDAWNKVKEFFRTLWDSITGIVKGAWIEIKIWLGSRVQDFVNILDVALGPFINFDDDIFGDSGGITNATSKVWLMKAAFDATLLTAQELALVGDILGDIQGPDLPPGFEFPAQDVTIIVQSFTPPHIHGITDFHPPAVTKPQGSGSTAKFLQHGGHFRAGEAMFVGESQAELLRFGRAGSVFTEEQTRRLAAASGGGSSSTGSGQSFHFGDIMLEGDPEELAREIGWLVANA